MQLLGTKEAADKLGTSPKRLRKFLRDSPDYGGTGMGGRYGFDEEAYNLLAESYFKWSGSKPAPRARRERASSELAYLNSDPAAGVDIVHRANRNPRLRKQLHTQRMTRQAKLLARMKEVGL
jgi:hypothetical protein